jgi:serine/threonine protein kinase
MNSSPVGTAAWCSPEVRLLLSIHVSISAFSCDRTVCPDVTDCMVQILEHAPYNEKADIYSFGVLLWELWTRSCPYDNEPNETIIRATLEHKR